MCTQGSPPLRVLTLLLTIALLTSLGAPATADSFLTDETFFPVYEEQMARLEALSWDSTGQALAALDEESDPLFHMRLITQAYFHWAMEPETEELRQEFLDALGERTADSLYDYLPLLDFGYALMVLDDDLNGLWFLEKARWLPPQEAPESEQAPPVEERDEPALFLALALCYAQTDAFLFGNPWPETTNLKREAVLNVTKAADSASRSPNKLAYAAGLAAVLDYLSYYEGFTQPLEEAGVYSRVDALWADTEDSGEWQ